MSSQIPRTSLFTPLLSIRLWPAALVMGALLAGCGGSSSSSRPSALTSHDDAALWYMLAELMPFTGDMAVSSSRILTGEPVAWLDRADAEGFAACDTGRTAVSVDDAQPQSLPSLNPGNFDVFTSNATHCELPEGQRIYGFHGQVQLGVPEGTPLEDRDNGLLLRAGRGNTPFVATERENGGEFKTTSAGVVYVQMHNDGSADQYASLVTTVTLTQEGAGTLLNSRWELTGAGGNGLSRTTYNADQQLQAFSARQSVTSRLEDEQCSLRGHTDVALTFIRDGAGNIAGGETRLQAGNRSAQITTLGRRHFLVTLGQTTVEYNSNGSVEEQERYEALRDALLPCFPLG